MGSIDRIGTLGVVAYSLDPRQSTVLPMGFAVPASVVGALHSVCASRGGVARPFQGLIFNDGDVPSSVSMDYRRVGGTRRTADVTLGAFDTRGASGACTLSASPLRVGGAIPEPQERRCEPKVLEAEQVVIRDRTGVVRARRGLTTD
jgi:hypothetical protein